MSVEFEFVSVNLRTVKGILPQQKVKRDKSNYPGQRWVDGESTVSNIKEEGDTCDRGTKHDVLIYGLGNIRKRGVAVIGSGSVVKGNELTNVI